MRPIMSLCENIQYCRKTRAVSTCRLSIKCQEHWMTWTQEFNLWLFTIKLIKNESSSAHVNRFWVLFEEKFLAKKCNPYVQAGVSTLTLSRAVLQHSPKFSKVTNVISGYGRKIEYPSSKEGVSLSQLIQTVINAGYIEQCIPRWLPLLMHDDRCSNTVHVREKQK